MLYTLQILYTYHIKNNRNGKKNHDKTEMEESGINIMKRFHYSSRFPCLLDYTKTCVVTKRNDGEANGMKKALEHRIEIEHYQAVNIA